MTIPRFRKIIWDYYHTHGRTLPWRQTRNPYHILVSEMMLQQTQVERVREKYQTFIETFPDLASLERAQLKDILSVWQGLGYNRRAIALKQIAREVMTTFHGFLPSSVDRLMQLPGVGRATASAIASFAFNRPTVFLETNIRRVFIHFFFADRENIRDAELLPFVEKALDRSDPRRWYYALMDYGAMLKREIANPNKKSSHYQRQSPFAGSNRQLRGMVLRTVLNAPRISKTALAKKLGKEPKHVGEILSQLEREEFIRREGNTYLIAE